MKFTINTTAKTITIHSSFKFEDLGVLRAQLPDEWWGFTIAVEPVTYYYPSVWYPPTINGDITGTGGFPVSSTFTSTDLNGQSNIPFGEN